MNHLSSVKHVIVILSGKGGVGKSTMAVQIALGLHAAGKKVNIFSQPCHNKTRIFNSITKWITAV